MIDRPDLVRALTERLVAIPSVSPDVEAETLCARALIAELPAGVEHGEWTTPDGRPVVWALARGRSRRTVVLLGHYDTVGGSEISLNRKVMGFVIALASEQGLTPAELFTRSPEAFANWPPDFVEECREPGTWLFGRGALDMKSGLAAGIAVLQARTMADPRPSGSVLLVATPDEEHLSAGMRTATCALPEFCDAEALELEGVVNLDYCLEPAVYLGVAGKVQLGIYVRGQPGHVADPGRGSNAIELAAHAVLALSAMHEDGIAPAALAMQDMRTAYSIEPPTEALVEFSVPWIGGSLDERMESCRRAIVRTLATAPLTGAGRTVRVQLACELIEPYRPSVPVRDFEETAEAARAYTLRILRQRCPEAPAVILHLLPPFYPPIPPGQGPFTTAVRTWAESEGVAVRGQYPFISDASYVAWPAESSKDIAGHLWAYAAHYSLPIEEARALNLEVVNLGPWGRDAHRPDERVHAPYAFARLPRLIARLVEHVLDGKEVER